MLTALRLLIIFLLCFLCQISFGQETSSDINKIVTKNDVYRGKIVSITKDSIFVELKNSKQLTLAKADVLIISHEDATEQVGIKIELIDGQMLQGYVTEITVDIIKLKLTSVEIIELKKAEIKSTSKSPNLNSNNYYSQPFFVPSALASQKGNHYLRSYFGLIYDFNFGVTDKLDFSVGSELISILMNDDDITPVFQLGGKYQITSSDSKINVGIAAKYIIESDDYFFMFFMPITIGNQKSNFSIIPTYLATNNGSNSFAIASSLITPINHKTFFSSDIIYNDVGISGTAMLNLVTKSDLSYGLGFIYSSSSGAVLPNVSFTFPISGKWKYE